MKYIITESQLSKLISEQEPEGRYGLERYGYNYTKPETLQPAQAKQQQAIKDLSSFIEIFIFILPFFLKEYFILLSFWTVMLSGSKSISVLLVIILVIYFKS